MLHTLIVFTPALFKFGVKPKSGSISALMQFVWAGVNAVNKLRPTRMRTKTIAHTQKWGNSGVVNL